MARKARPVPFAGRRVNSVIRDMRASPPTEWPKHLRLARKILVEELSLDDAKALSVLDAPFALLMRVHKQSTSGPAISLISFDARRFAEFSSALPNVHAVRQQIFDVFLMKASALHLMSKSLMERASRYCSIICSPPLRRPSPLSQCPLCADCVDKRF